MHQTAKAAALAAAVGLLGSLPAAPACALQSDRDQPIRIESDRAERNEKAGTTIYIGDVNLRQGTLLIRSDRLEIHTKNNDVTDVIATGRPAYLEQQPKPDKPLVKARAKTINYYVSNERLNLKGDASVEQEGSIVKSDVIDYYLDSELIKAHGGVKSANQRVHVVIPPSRVNEEQNPAAKPGKPAESAQPSTPAAEPASGTQQTAPAPDSAPATTGSATQSGGG